MDITIERTCFTVYVSQYNGLRELANAFTGKQSRVNQLSWFRYEG